MTKNTDDLPARSEFTLHAETLQGDLMKMALDEIKALPAVWARMSEDKQEEVIMRLGLRVAEAVRETVKILASRGTLAVKGELVQVRWKKELKIQIDASKDDENRHKLTDAIGQTVVIVIADAAEFLDGGKAVKADKNQRDLGV